mgnify:CR=1 FL=1
MSSNINELRRNNTSGVPALRLTKRRGHLVVDVTWYTDKRYSTSFPVKPWGPIEAVTRAMRKRRLCVGAVYDISPRQAWERLKRTMPDARA